MKMGRKVKVCNGDFLNCYLEIYFFFYLVYVIEIIKLYVGCEKWILEG